MASSSPSLIEKLSKELECSVCLELYTDPRTLPCLHAFCLHCLNGLAERRENQEPIACPECRTEVDLPEGDKFDAFPPSYYLNRLRYILSAQTGNHRVLCKSCTKQNEAVEFCFDCDCFICVECRELHSRLKITLGHRFAALSNFRDMDIQRILGGPQFCEEPRHNGELVKFFCETCHRCICQTCAITNHKNHEFVNLHDAAEQAKLHLEETSTALRDGVRQLEEQLFKNSEAKGKLEEDVAAAELSVRRKTQRFIELAKRHEREVMEQLALIRRVREQVFSDQKETLELHLGQLRSVIDNVDSVLRRGIGGEILQAVLSVSTRSAELLETVGGLQPVRNEHVRYVSNEDAYQKMEPLKLGWVSRRIIPRSYKHVSSFGARGFGDGEFQNPVGVAVDSTGDVFVADWGNHRVQAFSGEGRLLRKIGRHGRPNGRLQHPSAVAFDKTGNIIIADMNNARMQVFSTRGRWLKTFGKEVLKRPLGVSVTNDNNAVVGDIEAKKVFVFSPKGKLLFQFPCTVDNEAPTYCHAIFYDQKYFVCTGKRVLRVFNSRGIHLYDIGEGHLDTPTGFALEANDSLLLVCDSSKHSVLVFTLDGDLVNSFGTNEPVEGEVDRLCVHCITTGETNGRVFVCCAGNHCIHVFQPQC